MQTKCFVRQTETIKWTVCDASVNTHGTSEDFNFFTHRFNCVVIIHNVYLPCNITLPPRTCNLHLAFTDTKTSLYCKTLHFWKSDIHVTLHQLYLNPVCHGVLISHSKFEKDSSSLNENSLIINSPSCSAKPVRLSFYCGAQKVQNIHMLFSIYIKQNVYKYYKHAFYSPSQHPSQQMKKIRIKQT